MKILISLFCLVPMLAFAQDSYEDLFRRQLNASCERGSFVWEKVIEQTGEDVKYERESHCIRVDCAAGTAELTDADGTGQDLRDEFHYLLEYDYSSSYLREYFDVVEKNGVVATVREEDYDETALKKQVFEVNENGVLRYAESHVLKENLLYDLEVRTRVWFDDAGNYLRHETTTYTNPALKNGVHTTIRGKISS